MASPFQKYQSEQVQAINILPYTGAMAEQTVKSMGELGKGIGDTIKRYQQSKEEREQMAMVTNSIIEENLETVMDEVSQDDVTRLKETAPSHIKDIYKKAEKQGNGDWRAGLAGLANTDFKAFATLSQKYDADEKVKQAKYVESEKLRIDQYNAETANLNAQTNAQQVATQTARFKAEQAEIQEKKRLADLATGIQQTVVPDTEAIFEIKKDRGDIGDLYKPDGELIASGVEVNDALQAFGIKPEEVTTEEEAKRQFEEQAEYPVLATTRWLAGNDKFNVRADFNTARQTDPLAVDRFIRETLKQATYADGSLQDNPNITKFFNGGDIEGTLKEGEGLKSQAYRMAQGLATSVSMRKWGASQGVQMVPPLAKVSKAYIKVTGKSETEDRILRQVPIEDRRKEENRYDAFRLAYEKGGKVMPFSRDTYMATQGHRFFPEVEVNGVKMVRIGDKVYPKNSLSMYGTEGPPTGAQISLKEQQQTNFLEGFKNPVEVAKGEYWQFTGGARQWRGDFEKNSDILTQGVTDMQAINGIADKMIVMQKTGGRIEKLLSPSWQREYDNLNRQAQTYRRYFIATGQETEPDNARLADILADRSMFDSLNPELKIKIIESFRQIVADRVRGAWKAGGGKIKMSGERLDIKTIANQAGGRTFEELKKKYGEPKK